MSKGSLPRQIRFEVFKRDSFTCQYCGGKAPEVVLHVDHIEPRAEGGGDELLNLITSCEPCNLGKGARRLQDGSALEKQRKHLEDLQERREQIEMLLEWKKGLVDLESYMVEEVAKIWTQSVPGYFLNERGLQELKKILKKYGLDEVVEAIKTSSAQYLQIEKGKPTNESVETAWVYVAKICSVNAASKKKPYLRDLFYIRGILRKRLAYVNESYALELLERAVQLKASIDSLRNHARAVRNWTQWREGMETYIAEQQEKENRAPVEEAPEEPAQQEPNPPPADAPDSPDEGVAESSAECKQEQADRPRHQSLDPELDQKINDLSWGYSDGEVFRPSSDVLDAWRTYEMWVGTEFQLNATGPKILPEYDDEEAQLRAGPWRVELVPPYEESVDDIILGEGSTFPLALSRALLMVLLAREKSVG